MVAEKVDSFLATLFPRRCILCDQPAGLLNCCLGCRCDLPWISSPCLRCGDVLPADYQGSTCGRCSELSSPVSRIISALVYEYPVDQLIAMAKFQARADCANALGELLADRGTHRIGDLHQAKAGHIYIHDVTQLEISSSDIRELVAAGRDARFLTPDSVRAVIEKSGCYQAAERSDND